MIFATGSSGNEPQGIKPIPKINKWSHYPIIGSFIGIGRIFKGGFNILRGCGEKIRDMALQNNNSLANKHISRGFKNGGRGFVELFPIVGNIIAYNMDVNKAEKRAIKWMESSQHPKRFKEAIQLVNEWGHADNLCHIISSLAEKRRYGEAFNFYLNLDSPKEGMNYEIGKVVDKLHQDVSHSFQDLEAFPVNQIRDYAQQLTELRSKLETRPTIQTNIDKTIALLGGYTALKIISTK